MSKNNIIIDGEKLKAIINELGLNMYTISTEKGYSRNLVNQAIRTKKASPVVQNLLKDYGIYPDEYRYKEPINEEDEELIQLDNQLTFDDIEVDSISRAEIKQIVKESMLEVLNSLEWSIDPLKKTVTFRAGKDPR
jgi:hypothetical protein